MIRERLLILHLLQVAFKARSLLFMVRQPVAELSPSAYIPLYNTLVQLHDYMQVYSPNSIAGVICLKRIQRLVAGLIEKFICFIRRKAATAGLCTLYSFFNGGLDRFLFRQFGLA